MDGKFLQGRVRNGKAQVDRPVQNPPARGCIGRGSPYGPLGAAAPTTRAVSSRKLQGVKGNGKRETLPTRRPGTTTFPFPRQPARDPVARRWTQEELHAVRGQPLEDVARQLGHRRDPGDRAGKKVLKGPRRLPDHHLNPATRYHLPRTERSTYSPPSSSIKSCKPTVFPSTASATPNLPKWIEAWNPSGILCACDPDTAGDQNAEALLKHVPRVHRCRPDAAHDWNEIIRRSP